MALLHILNDVMHHFKTGVKWFWKLDQCRTLTN